MAPTPSGKPVRLAVIGAGYHSRTSHLPALAHLNRLNPGALALVAIVDLDADLARRCAAEFGFAAAYRDADEMLAREKPEACLALTPVALNAAMTLRLVREGIPVLMEKPLGATIAEARNLVSALGAAKTHVMVSMNRRFDPLLKKALAWIGGRPILSLAATMTRQGRTEPDFVEHTGLHVVDVVRMLGGEIRACTCRRQPEGRAGRFRAEISFATGASGTIDLAPTSGGNAEVLGLAGNEFRVEVRSREFDSGLWRAWSGGRLTVEEFLPPDTPLFIANGTLAETEAFLGAVRGEGAFSPAPADVLPAAELCHVIATAQPAGEKTLP